MNTFNDLSPTQETAYLMRIQTYMKMDNWFLIDRRLVHKRTKVQAAFVSVNNYTVLELSSKDSCCFYDDYIDKDNIYIIINELKTINSEHKIKRDLMRLK